MTPPRDDVAIIGASCIFPGAADVETYWRNILEKVDAIGDPPESWGSAELYDPNGGTSDRVYARRGGHLGELARFNPLARHYAKQRGRRRT